MKGVYLLCFQLPGSRVRVGKLGEFFFDGTYVYVGSAQRGEARIWRHLRKHKKKKWHIDYLTDKASFIFAAIFPLEKEFEERIAKILAERFEYVLSLIHI